LLKNNLSKTFDCDVIKDHFPYKFVNKDRFYYIGKIPDIKYYNNISLDKYKK
jgi:hypothetical protein